MDEKRSYFYKLTKKDLKRKIRPNKKLNHELVSELIFFIDDHRKIVLAVSTELIKEFLISIDEEQNNKSDAAIMSWIRRFLSNHNYTYRRPTHVAQLTPENVQEKK